MFTSSCWPLTVMDASCHVWLPRVDLRTKYASLQWEASGSGPGQDLAMASYLSATDRSRIRH
jgi:hypothetical protein